MDDFSLRSVTPRSSLACFLVTEDVNVLTFFQSCVPNNLVLIPLRGHSRELAHQLQSLMEKYEGPLFLDTETLPEQKDDHARALLELKLPLIFFGSRTRQIQQQLQLPLEGKSGPFFCNFPLKKIDCTFFLDFQNPFSFFYWSHQRNSLSSEFFENIGEQYFRYFEKLITGFLAEEGKSWKVSMEYNHLHSEMALSWVEFYYDDFIYNSFFHLYQQIRDHLQQFIQYDMMKLRIKILMEEKSFSFQLSHEILDKAKISVAKKFILSSSKYAQKNFSA